jgi:hypothetical protein
MPALNCTGSCKGEPGLPNSTGRKRFSDIVTQGVTWGLGHTTTLFAMTGLALFLGRAVPVRFANHLESAVGIMLIGLGANVLIRIWKDRVHFHAHSHGTGEHHFHIHTHAAETRPHSLSLHDHTHRFNWRTLLVGMTHGMAGSAALLVLTVSKEYSVAEGLVFILLFGIGSMIGMGLVSAAMGVPIMLTARFLTWANRSLQICVGVATMLFGVHIVYTTLLST